MSGAGAGLSLASIVTMVECMPILEFLTGIDVLALASSCRQLANYMSASKCKLWQHICNGFSKYSMLPLPSGSAISYKDKFMQMMLPIVVRVHEFPNDILLGYDPSGRQLVAVVEQLYREPMPRPMFNRTNRLFHNQTHNGIEAIDAEGARFTAMILFSNDRDVKLAKSFLIENIDALNFPNGATATPISIGTNIFVYYKRRAISLTVVQMGVSPVAGMTLTTFPEADPPDRRQRSPRFGTRGDSLCALNRAAPMPQELRVALNTAGSVLLPNLMATVRQCRCHRIVMTAGIVSATAGFTCSSERLRKGLLIKGDIAGSLITSLVAAERVADPDRKMCWITKLFKRHARKTISLADVELAFGNGSFPNLKRFLKLSPNYHICFGIFNSQIFLPCSYLRHLRFDSIFEALLELEHFWTEDRVHFYSDLGGSVF